MERPGVKGVEDFTPNIGDRRSDNVPNLLHCTLIGVIDRKLCMTKEKGETSPTTVIVLVSTCIYRIIVVVTKRSVSNREV